MSATISDQPTADGQLPLDFDAVMSGAETVGHDRYDPEGYDPVGRTAEYARRIVEFERKWETTIGKAREKLLGVDARELYLSFLLDTARLARDGGPRATQHAELLRHVAVNGLGMGRHQINILSPPRGGIGWRVEIDTTAVRDHLERQIVGPNFLNVVAAADANAGPAGAEPRPPLVGASDVSQHLSQIPLPAGYFKRTVPFVLNNAAGALLTVKDGAATYENLFDPRPNEQLLRWMLIDPSYRDELDDEDYRRCLGSSMDVGQYNFDHEYLLNADRRIPDVILRDGSVFPQDAKLDNYAISTKRGDFTREAIRKLLGCLSLTQQLKVLYCGVVKRVNLKVFSGPLEWYIQREIDPDWQAGGYTLADGEAMSFLLPTPDFSADKLDRVIGTCLIRRSFTTRATLNLDPGLPRLQDRLDEFERRHQGDCDLRPYRRLCEIGHFYMFFLGHSRSPQQQLPRYEFFDAGHLAPGAAASAILSAVRMCSLVTDNDHSFMQEEPVQYLLPNVTQQAHRLSKEVGRYIDRLTGQHIMSRYKQRLAAAGG